MNFFALLKASAISLVGCLPVNENLNLIALSWRIGPFCAQRVDIGSDNWLLPDGVK